MHFFISYEMYHVLSQIYFKVKELIDSYITNEIEK